MVSETGQQEAEGFVKVSWERGRRTAMMNGEIMVCFFTEWMKEKDEPRSHMLSENLNFISDLWMLYMLAPYLIIS